VAGSEEVPEIFRIEDMRGKVRAEKKCDACEL